MEKEKKKQEKLKKSAKKKERDEKKQQLQLQLKKSRAKGREVQREVKKGTNEDYETSLSAYKQATDTKQNARWKKNKKEIGNNHNRQATDQEEEWTLQLT